MWLARVFLVTIYHYLIVIDYHFICLCYSEEHKIIAPAADLPDTDHYFGCGHSIRVTKSVVKVDIVATISVYICL